MKMINISCLKRPNFIPDEFIYSNTALKLGVDNNIYDQKILDNLMIVADKIQEVRNLLGKSIKISSAYRCIDLNRAVGSLDSSQHLKGQAIDFTCPEFGNPEKIVRFLKEKKIVVDQVLMEGSWIHLSIKKNKNRNEFASFLPDKKGVRKKILLT
jgi:zinc D-Ala-D-Ala carboxypeptidase